jgi:carboxymethylenebutenolidase
VFFQLIIAKTVLALILPRVLFIKPIHTQFLITHIFTHKNLKMRHLTSILTLLVIACLFGCQQQNQSDPMARFVKDQSFINAHEKPLVINFVGTGKTITFPTPDGKTGSAYALMAAKPSKKYLLVIHEWWGLNDNIKKEAERLADSLKTVNVIALDIYDGKVASSPDEAGKIMSTIAPTRAEAIVKGAIAMAGKKAKIGTIGWCFGGGWSLRSSIIAGSQGVGCVMYYGMPVEKAADLAPLKADVLGLFGKKDAYINPTVVKKFEELAAATGKKVEIHSYDADHAFANPSNPKFDAVAAKEANGLALAFLKKKFN